jgi:hypothetical protein
MDKDSLDAQLVGAAFRGDAEAVTALLAQGANPDAPDSRGLSALRAAGLSGHLAATRALLQAGADPNRRDSDGGMALFTAADDGYIEVAQELIAYGADVHVQDETGTTALMVAAAGGWTEMVEFLIGEGADVNATDAEGWTALDWAEQEGYDDVVALLIRATEAHLMQIEQELVDTLIKGHVTFYDRYFADTCTFTGTEGKVRNKEEFLTLLRDRKYETFIFDNMQVSVYSSTAEVTFRSSEMLIYEGQTVRSHNQKMHVFVWQDGHWQIVAEQETPIPEP